MEKIHNNIKKTKNLKSNSIDSLIWVAKFMVIFLISYFLIDYAIYLVGEI